VRDLGGAVRETDRREHEPGTSDAQRADHRDEHREPAAQPGNAEDRQAADERPPLPEAGQQQPAAERQTGPEGQRDRQHPQRQPAGRCGDHQHQTRTADLEHEDRHVGHRDLQRPWRGGPREPPQEPDAHRHPEMRLDRAGKERARIGAVDGTARDDLILDRPERHAPRLGPQGQRHQMDGDEGQHRQPRDRLERHSEGLPPAPADQDEGRDSPRGQGCGHRAASAHEPQIRLQASAIRERPVTLA